MKYIKIGLLLCITLTCFAVKMKAQIPKIQVNAVVRTPDGKPIPDAIINSNELKAYAVSGTSGSFSLEIAPRGKFSVRAKGYKDQIIEAGEDLTEIVLEPLGDLTPVNVAFRTVNERDLMGGVSVINLPEKMENDYTTYSLDGLSSYIGGYNGNLWGQGALVLIDGVPRDAGSDILSSEIEQITVLKGVGAVALYGSRAAKGVILITTKRGKAYDRKINVRANTGFHVPKRYPKYLSSWEYMTLYNEALRNDGLDELYDEKEIHHSWTGKDAYRYPNIDFYSSDYLKKVYNKSDVTAEISDGTDRAQFYTNIGMSYQNSLLNFGEGKDDNNLRFNARGNIDYKFNDFISGSVDATFMLNNNRYSHGDYWGRAATLRPNRFSPLIPISALSEDDEMGQLQIKNSKHLIDGKYLLGGTQLDQTNPFADIYAGGHNKSSLRQFQLTAGLDFNLRSLLEGLSFETKFAIDYSSSYTESYNNQYAVYEPKWYAFEDGNKIDRLVKFGEDRSDGIQNVHDSWNQQTIAFSGQFNYIKTLNTSHNLNAILLATGHQRSDIAAYHKISNANLGLQLGYNYEHKYYADFSSAFVHSAKFSSKKRQAFSPTLTLGWRISEEEFLAKSSVVDDLKLTVSGGILHTDLDFDYYMYKGYYSQTEGAWFGWKDGASNMQSTDSRRGDNADLGFVKRKEFNVGIDASLFNKLLTINTNFFINRMEGMPILTYMQYPNYFSTGWPNSSFLPYVNNDIDQRVGVDFAVNLNKKLGQVDFIFGLTGTILKTEAIKRDEMFQDAYQNRTGKPLDAIWGLVSNGFYEDEDDIANYNATPSFGEVKAGDIKYVDQNGDGVIDSKDEVYLGRAGWSSVPFALGLNLTAKWNNFTCFLRGTGNFGTYGIKNSSYHWVYGDRKYSDEVLNRWTEGSKKTATYPRLTTQSGDNNFRTSDFWMYKSDLFTLAKVQISYDLPRKMLEKSFVRELGVYVSGDNLLTLSKEWRLMEMNIGGAPQTRFFNLGVKATF